MYTETEEVKSVRIEQTALTRARYEEIEFVAKRVAFEAGKLDGCNSDYVHEIENALAELKNSDQRKKQSKYYIRTKLREAVLDAVYILHIDVSYSEKILLGI